MQYIFWPSAGSPWSYVPTAFAAYHGFYFVAYLLAVYIVSQCAVDIGVLNRKVKVRVLSSREARAVRGFKWRLADWIADTRVYRKSLYDPKVEWNRVELVARRWLSF